jgi:RNase H-fold protein (predicted Holliday junction resolvase)
VVGESKDFKGHENPIMKEAREFAEKLKAARLEVVFHPEILTSVEAEKLQGKNEMLDASAAAIILKSYIEIKHA